jgi:site-specific DNA recombinase
VPGSEDRTGVERLPAEEIERVVLSGLKKRLADTGWLADQINGHAKDAPKVVDILRAIGKCRVDTDGADDDALKQIFPSNIDRIDRPWNRGVQF